MYVCVCGLPFFCVAALPLEERSPNEQKKLNAFKAFLTIQLAKKKATIEKLAQKTP